MIARVATTVTGNRAAWTGKYSIFDYLSIVSICFLMINYGIDSLISALEARPHEATVTNPYRLPNRSDNLRHYLRALLDQPGRRILVVGEALGYRGGLLTGIPLSSERLVREQAHPFWRRLAPDLTIDGRMAEATASIVWHYLAERRRIPLFWNAFPFHPHRSGEPHSNRPPTAADIAEGIPYLQAVVSLYRPVIIGGLGTKGTLAAQRALPGQAVRALRHPSYGGKPAFVEGMHRLLGS